MNFTIRLPKLLITVLLLGALFTVSAQKKASEKEDLDFDEWLKLYDNTTTVSTVGTPAKIKNSYAIWTDFDLRKKADAVAFKNSVGPDLFEQIADNCNETSGWPGAISSYEERNKVRDQMDKYVCYYIGEVDDKYVLRVPVAENKFLPYGVRPEHDIFFVVTKGDVDLTGNTENSSSSPPSSNSSGNTTESSSSSMFEFLLDEEDRPSGKGAGTTGTNTRVPAKITGTGGIYSTFNLTNSTSAGSLRTLLGTKQFDDVAVYCKEDRWPLGIRTLTERNNNRQKMNDYKAYKIAEFDGMYILHVPVAENNFMPYSMQLFHDIYFVINMGDVTLSTTAATSTNSSSGNTAYDFFSGESFDDWLNTKGGSSAVNFEQQLNKLIDALPGNFASIKGEKTPGKPGGVMPNDEWESKVKLEGAEKTVVTEAWLSKEPSVMASYPEYTTKSEAIEKYKELISKVAAAKINCCTMVQSKEVAAEVTAITNWLTFGSDGAYSNMVIEVSYMKTQSFDKTTYKMTDRWLVYVSVYTQK